MKQKGKINNNLQKYRVWKGLSRKKLSEEIGISASYLRLIEKENHCPKWMMRKKLSDFFEVSQEQMFNLGKDE